MMACTAWLAGTLASPALTERMNSGRHCPITLPSSTLRAATLEKWASPQHQALIFTHSFSRSPFFGRLGWVRSDAWIRVFSSIESTLAWSGGST
jgi:hypothetical protein